MKIAYCIRGRPRQLDAGYIQYMNHIGSKHDVDVFIHTWRDKPEQLRYRSSDWDRDLNKIVDLYKPVKIDIEAIPSHGSCVFKNSTIPIEKHDECIQNYQNDQYSLMCVTESLWSYPSLRKYDYIIFSRFDLRFHKNVVYPTKDIGINHDHNGYCDLFVICKPEASIEIGNIYPLRTSLYTKTGGEFIPERIWKAHLQEFNVEITGNECTVI
jgi:hypothetical protein